MTPICHDYTYNTLPLNKVLPPLLYNNPESHRNPQSPLTQQPVNKVEELTISLPFQVLYIKKRCL